MAVTPVYIATWNFGQEACEVGLRILAAGGRALDAVERGANAVEENPEVSSVGYGGLPNAEGVVEMDAALMDGPTHRAGAVAAMTGIRRPISVARAVMERTPHVMLAGQNARRFALREGFSDADLLTDAARARWEAWRREQAAPDVAHFPDTPPRERAWNAGRPEASASMSEEDLSHDTVGVCALDRNGDLAAGCTTSGLAWKTPGRVGDSPIVGAGLYVDNAVGAAAATGNGDEILKCALSFRAVSMMEQGRSPQEACEEAIRYLLRKRPHAQNRGAAVIALGADGRIGQAATQEGFRRPDRLWVYACTEEDAVVVREGVYVTGPPAA